MRQFVRNTHHADRHDPHALGLLVSRLLAGAWRPPSRSSDPSTTVNLSEAELTEITPILCQSGAGALAWCEIRNSPLASTVAGDELHEVYRRHRLSALIHQREIAYVFSLLNAEGIEAVLVKGWAIARRYPDAALRPYGDIDLCIRPDQIEKAQAVLRCLENLDGHQVDLHSGFGEIGSSVRQTSVCRVSPKVPSWRRQRQTKALSDISDWDELFDRSQLVLCEPGVVTTGSQAKTKDPGPKSGVSASIPVRILSDEDHLRILSLHLLRSGAWRPPWLCDVALLLERRGNLVSAGNSSDRDSARIDFDWDVCLGSDRLHAGWVAATIGLAHQLLGATIEDTPFAKNARPLPRWLVPAVLRQWGRLRYTLTLDSLRRARFSNHSNAKRGGAPLRLNEPPEWRGVMSKGIPQSLVELYARWDNPIRSTVAVGGQFNNWPRLPYRVAESVLRVPELPAHLRLLIERRTGLRRRGNPLIAPIKQNGSLESV
jgi:putative nucleotidyltransferase-like protein